MSILLPLRLRDRILELKQWSWRLKLSDGRAIPYNSIHVELAKRYRTSKGLYNHRLDGVVHFAGRVDPTRVSWMELWAYPPGDRPAARMRWNLKPH